MPLRNAINAGAITAGLGLCSGFFWLAHGQTPAQPRPFEQLAAECAPDIHPTTLKGVISTESSWNPYAIGVVDGRLDRQPRSLAEAVATARALERQGYNFSMGLGQVNRHNLSKYGETFETVFEPCRNLQAGSTILKDCFQRAKARVADEQRALRAAFSCYYSGNFTRGFRPDKAGQPSYVQKVVANAAVPAPPIPVVPAIRPQSSDGAMAVRSTGRAVAPERPAQAPAPWVTFADNPQPASPPGAQPTSAKEPAVKLRIVPPGLHTPPMAQDEPMQREAAAVQPGAPRSGPQDAPFVQLVH